MGDNKNCDLENTAISFVKQSRNELQSEELYRRKKTLQDYQAKIFPEATEFAQSTYQQIFAECHLQVVQCLRDRSEACRELALQLLTHFIQHLDPNEYHLTYIFPVLVDRIGTAELVEESEELRLDLLHFLTLIVTTYARTECLVPFLNDTVRILCETAVDRYPKVKQATCTCIIELAAALPKHFHLQCETLVQPVLHAFVHQHYRIRVAAVAAIGVIVLHSTGTGIVQQTVGPLAERLFDSVPAVRQTVAQVAARLLTEYRDRYSHFHRLLPLILSGLCDEVADTRTESERLWATVGQKYEQENEQELREQQDYAAVGAVTHYPAGVQRPGLGCRVLVQRNASKMVPALCTELSSWREDIRVRCAQLLCTVALHCEQLFVQCLPQVVPAMCTAGVDQEPAVRQNVAAAGRVIGACVPVGAWCALVLPALRNAPTHGHLLLLRSLAAGTPDLATVSPELAALLASEAVRDASRQAEYQRELVECCRPLVHEPATGEQLFEVLVCVVALSSAPDAAEAARALLQRIGQPAQAAASLLRRFADAAGEAPWSAVCTDRCVFDTLLLEWGQALGPHLALVGAVLERALAAECEAEAQLRTYHAVSSFLAGDVLQTQPASGAVFLERFIGGILVAALVWRAGRTAEALRTAAAFCLSQALPHVQSVPGELQQLLALLSTLLEDASWRTRLYCVRSLAELGRLCGAEAQWANRAAVALLKRLDDPNDAVRLEALEKLGAVGEQAHAMEPQNVRYLVDSVLIHMDDDEARVRQAALGVLRAVGGGHRAYVLEKLETEKPMFRNSSACDQLLEYLSP